MKRSLLSLSLLPLLLSSALAGDSPFQEFTRNLVTKDGGDPSPWIVFFGQLHPIVLHMPIGMVIGVFLMETVGLFRKTDFAFAIASRFLLGIASLTAWIASAFGMFWSLEFGNKEELYWHTVCGLIFSVLVTLCWFVKRRRLNALQDEEIPNGKGRLLYTTLLWLTMGVMTWTGHLGGDLVHGTPELPEPLNGKLNNGITFVGDLIGADTGAARKGGKEKLGVIPEGQPILDNTKAVPNEDAPETGTDGTDAKDEKDDDKSAAASDKELVSFTKDIKPLFEKHCVECHGPDKAKGKLHMDTQDGLERGGREGPLFVAGHPDESDLIYFITTDDEDELMPPPDDDVPPLTKEAIQLITDWVAQGAKFD